MATISVADYDIVTDKPVPAPASLSLNTPNINLGIRPVLSWVVIPGPNGVTYEMSINSRSLGTFKASTTHGRQEVVDLEIGHETGAPKTLDIVTSSGDGKFSDIVLLFQVDVPL
jgi:hypothetical protein